MIRLTLSFILISFSACFAQSTRPVDREASYFDEIIQLTHGFERAGEAYFSNDMNWIIFQAIPRGEKHYAMYLAPLKRDGDSITGAGEAVRITAPGSRNTCGFFAPDDSFIIFASTTGKEDPNAPEPGFQRAGGDYRWAYPEGMEIFRADDWKQRVSNAKPGDVVDLATTPITNVAGYDAECAISPDGKWIVFTSNRRDDGAQVEPESRKLDLYIMKSDGTHVVRLMKDLGQNGGPFFSPDGKRLVYRSDRKGNSLLQVYTAELVFDSAGDVTGITNEVQLTDDANVNWGPFWHPGGGHIVYSTSVHGHTNYELYLMKSDGSGKTRLTYAAGPDVLPVFSPDGKYLMWSARRAPDNTTQVFVTRVQLPDVR